MSDHASEIAENFARVRERIAAAAVRAGRDINKIKLVAVTKTKPLEDVDAAVAAGQRVFGENYAQEASSKMEARPDLDWHFIGSLQSNKVKLVAGRAKLIESVDKLKLAEEIAKVSSAKGVVQDVLLQVHIGGEGTKHGIDPIEGPETLNRLASLEGIRLRGLMSLPPLAESESTGRRRFAELREYLEAWKSSLPRDQASRFTELSMGTSADFEWAILEGATLVRVGTVLFGARQSKA